MSEPICIPERIGDLENRMTQIETDIVLIPKGDQGEPGEQGPPGEQGDEGDPGIPGTVIPVYAFAGEMPLPPHVPVAIVAGVGVDAGVYVDAGLVWKRLLGIDAEVYMADRYRVSIAYETWAALAAHASPAPTDGMSAVVFGDAGTHTDPVVGGTVSNTGVFRYSTSPAGWRRLANLESTDAAASLASTVAIQTALNGELTRIGTFIGTPHAAFTQLRRVEITGSTAKNYLNKVIKHGFFFFDTLRTRLVLTIHAADNTSGLNEAIIAQLNSNTMGGMAGILQYIEGAATVADIKGFKFVNIPQFGGSGLIVRELIDFGDPAVTAAGFTNNVTAGTYTDSRLGLGVFPAFTQYTDATITALAAAAALPVAQTQARVGSTKYPFDTSATAVAAYLDSIIEDLVIFNGKSHDYRISFVQTSAGALTVDIWDEQLGGPVAYIQVSSPNYGALPERIQLVASNRLPGLYPATTGHSGLQGYIKIRGANCVVSGASYAYTDPLQCRINRSKVTKRFQYRNRHWADDFQEIIRVGPTRPLTTIRAGRQSIYDTPLVDQDNPSQIPLCARANPLWRIAFLYDPGTYTGVSEHTPDWVYDGGLYRDTVIFEHAPASTRAIIEAHGNSGAFDLTIRNTMPEGAGGSARYGWHMDMAHLLNAPDSQGDFNRLYSNDFHRVKFIIGAAAQVQVYGSGIGPNAEANFTDCELWCENGSYGGPILSFNNSSSTVGGGKVTINNCVDRTGRATNVSSIAVQTKNDATYKSLLYVNNCKNFHQVSSSPSGTPYPNKWALLGNNNMTVLSTIGLGDTMNT